MSATLNAADELNLRLAQAAAEDLARYGKNLGDYPEHIQWMIVAAMRDLRGAVDEIDEAAGESEDASLGVAS